MHMPSCPPTQSASTHPRLSTTDNALLNESKKQSNRFESLRDYNLPASNQNLAKRRPLAVNLEECEQNDDCAGSARCIGSSMTYKGPELSACHFCVFNGWTKVCEKVAPHCFCFRNSYKCDTTSDCVENEVCRTLSEQEVKRFDLDIQTIDTESTVCAPQLKDTSTTGKLNFEDCKSSTECEKPRQCVFIDTNFKRFSCPEEKQELCSCVSNNYSCNTSADCPEGESCRSHYDGTPFACVSHKSDFLSVPDKDKEDEASNNGSGETGETDEPSQKGLNGEWCEYNSDCEGTRKCISFHRKESSVSRTKTKICFSETPRCSPSKTCAVGEVCVGKGRSAICLSGRISWTANPDGTITNNTSKVEISNEKEEGAGAIIEPSPLCNPSVEPYPSTISTEEEGDIPKEDSSSEAAEEVSSPEEESSNASFSSSDNAGVDEAACIGIHLLMHLDKEQLLFDSDLCLRCIMIQTLAAQRVGTSWSTKEKR